MPTFRCSTCGASFNLSEAVLSRYPGWTPKQCRKCKPGKKGTKGSSSTREENLQLEQVLAKYTGGPKDGVFTDGSAVPNPGRGGWGFVWVAEDQVIDQGYGHEGHTTNNAMELRALIEAYKVLPEGAKVSVYTDSKLCVDTITQWAPGWEKRGWKRKGGEIKNLELVQELLTLYRSHPGCTLEWIAAHSGHRWNEYADSLATAWNRAAL